MTDLTIANEIKKQIGSKALYMLGAKNLAGDTNSLSFKISGSKFFTHIRISISLNSLDLYDVTFIKIRKFDIVNKKEVKGIYNDMLHKVIEQETGLYTSI
jgi:hypothetical protein